MHELALEDSGDVNLVRRLYARECCSLKDLFTRQEARELGQKQEDVASRLQLEMLTPDERDEATSVLVEIRPGVGGDEACLWAEDAI